MTKTLSTFSLFQGICPGNRLKLLPAHDSGCYSPSPLSSPCPSIGTISQISAATTPTATTPHSDFYENTTVFSQMMQKQGKRRSWHIMPNKVSELIKCVCFVTVIKVTTITQEIINFIIQ